MKPDFRRFTRIGTKKDLDRLIYLVEEKDLDKLIYLVEEKGLSREDVILILQTIRLNHDSSSTGNDETVHGEKRPMKITLKAARVNAGFTLEQASAKIGFARSTLSCLETGERSPKHVNLQRLCELYGVDIQELNLNPPKAEERTTQ